MIYTFILLFTLQSCGSACPSDSSSADIHVTTMNVAWYGSTKFHPLKDDVRDPVIKDFIKTDLKSTDIFLFQEITKPEQFEGLLHHKYKCLAYDNRGGGHQYVLTCFDTDKFELLDSSEELFSADRTLYISEKRERLRDVLVTSFKNIETGHIIHTFNLHLKAGSNEDEKRREQIKSLLKQIDDQDLPRTHTVILGGDFNTYERHVEGKDDKVNEIVNILKFGVKSGFDFFTEYDSPTTLAKIQKTFDYLLIDTPKEISNYTVHSTCNKPEEPKRKFDDYEFFKKTISDHCPVTTTLSL